MNLMEALFVKNVIVLLKENGFFGKLQNVFNLNVKIIMKPLKLEIAETNPYQIMDEIRRQFFNKPVNQVLNQTTIQIKNKVWFQVAAEIEFPLYHL